MAVQQADPVAVEIHRRALENITNEAAITLTRTSGSPVIYEVQDFATSLLDLQGEHLSLSVTVLFHAGSSLLGTQAIIDQLQGKVVHEGDGWIVNDPFESGAMHQGDVAVITPQFYKGEHIGWAFSNVHVMDVGGSGVSGFAPGAASVFEEGVRFPPTQVIKGGQIDPEWEAYIAANVRIAPLVLNDMRSMIAANNVSQKKLVEAIDRFGLERFQEYCEINKEMTEAAFRARIAQLPDGVYETTEWIEFDGHGKDLVLDVGCRMEVDGSDLRFEFSGADQVDAFLNATPGVVYGSAMTAIMTTIGYGDMPFNAGMWRPVSIDVGKPGTIVNAVPPVPVSNAHATTGNRVLKGVREVLNQAMSLSEDAELRSRVGGHPCDGSCLAPLAGLGHGDSPTVMFFMDQVSGLGGGAQSIFDGQDGYGLTVAPGLSLPSIETSESLQPALYLWRRLRRNSGGPGQNRGGQALESTYAMYDTEAMNGAVTVGCTDVPSRGVGGGFPGATCEWNGYFGTNVDERIDGAGQLPLEGELAGDSPRTAANVGRITFESGDVIRMSGGGGGGAGDPLLREPDAVAQDVAADLITAEHAERAYGVVTGPDGSFDADATARRRGEIRSDRIGGDPAREQRPPDTPGVAIGMSSGPAPEWVCAYCDEALCATGENWRTVSRSEPVSVVERFRHLGMGVRDREDATPILIEEHHCPGCAGLLGIDVYPEGFEGYASPVLR